MVNWSCANSLIRWFEYPESNSLEPTSEELQTPNTSYIVGPAQSQFLEFSAMLSSRFPGRSQIEMEFWVSRRISIRRKKDFRPCFDANSIHFVIFQAMAASMAFKGGSCVPKRKRQFNWFQIELPFALLPVAGNLNPKNAWYTSPRLSPQMKLIRQNRLFHNHSTRKFIRCVLEAIGT